MTKKIVDFMTALILIIVGIFCLISLCSCNEAPKKTEDNDHFNEIQVNTIHVEEIQYETILTENIITE